MHQGLHVRREIPEGKVKVLRVDFRGGLFRHKNRLVSVNFLVGQDEAVFRNSGL